MDSGAGLQVIDISNPANPQRTGGFGPTAGARGVAVAGNFVYVADSAGLLILYHATQIISNSSAVAITFLPCAPVRPQASGKKSG